MRESSMESSAIWTRDDTVTSSLTSLRPFRFVAVAVCGRSSLWPFRFVAVPVCGRFGLWPFRFVAVPACGRFGLWPFRFLAVPVCGRFGLWPFRLWPFRFVAVMTCYRWAYRKYSTQQIWRQTSTHENDVIISAMASEITSLTIVYSIVYSGTD